MMPTTRYTSIFLIDGEPILPPLMTMEKRFEMQMYREKAIRMERKYTNERQARRVQFCETLISESALGQLGCTYSESTSIRSSDADDEDKRNPSENSSSFQSTPLKPYKLIECETGQDRTLIDCGTNTLSMTSEDDIKERMSKLSKSKTICFDNTSNTIIRSMTEEEIEYASGQSEKHTEIYLCQMAQDVNLDGAEQNKKKLNIPLMQSIPSIYVNPPTPLTGPNNISEALSATESVDSFDISGFQSSQATQSHAMENTEDSTEEFTESEDFKKQNLTTRTARVLYFDEMQNDLKNTSPPSEFRCEGGENPSDFCFAIRSPQRSATSPSLKSLSETFGTSSLTTSPRADDTSAHSLVRSNSFTLEGPSKALLEHIRQQNRVQKVSKESDSTVRSPTPSRKTPNKLRSTPSPSACRDTIESKAKRVQKKPDVKSSARATSNARSKSKSTFKNYSSSTAPIWNSPLPPLKIKRSPYDGKPAAAAATAALNKPHAARAKSAQKYPSLARIQKSQAVKKSTSSTTYTVKNEVSRSSLPSNINSNANSATDDQDTIDEIDKRHHQKLLSLIAQQQEEQRRLQQAFETQQKILLEQLNSERYRNFQMETDHSKATLYSEGVANMLPVQSNAENTQRSIYSETNNLSFERSSPSFNVSNSYMSPGLGGLEVVREFSTTTTCELPLNVSSMSYNGNSTSQRPFNIADMPSFPYTNNGAVNGNTNEIIESTMESKSQHQHPLHHSRENIETDFEKFNTAATIINAYARGFLVRRLFQTEQIQRIVQTIRDTLVFVLNLHMETLENLEEAYTPSNIKLKARLLQQLSSACRTLYLIFFQTSVKERMEIISRDRKRIKTKLLSMSLKRSPRIA